MGGKPGGRRKLRSKVRAFLESLPGGLPPLDAASNIDWAARDARLSPAKLKERLKEREQAAGRLRELAPVVGEIAGDRSIPSSIRRTARLVQQIIDNESIPAEVRLLHIRLLIRFASRDKAPSEFDFLWPPRGGALPVPDDTPWAPKPRTLRKP